MKLEPGKIYVTRGGYKAECFRKIRGEDGFDFIVIVDHGPYEDPHVYREDGSFFARGQESSLDLVKEWE